MSVEERWPPAALSSDAGGSDGGLTRRRLLELGAQGALTIGASSMLVACGAAGSGVSSKSLSGGKPVRGGTLRLGMITGGTAETLNPALASTFTDILRVYQVFDYLFLTGEDIKTLVPSLASSAEASRSASVWLIHLRRGVRWHDGKPFTADDVVWTIKSWGSASNYAHGIVGQFIDFKSVRKRGPLTVEVPLVRPAAQFPSLFTYPNCAVVQNGATAKAISARAVGTGPFKLVSFTPGSQSVFAKNSEYWRAPDKPYIDTLVVDSSFTDEASRSNALLGGQVDVAALYPNQLAKQQLSAGNVNVLTSPGTGGSYFTMRVDKGPLADVRVRQAMKLLIDRPALVEGVLNGLGEVGNDYVRDVEYVLEGAPAKYDVEKARSLLKTAGREGMTITLQTVAGVSRYLDAATLLAEQAKAAGVNIVVRTIPYGTYFTAASGWPAQRYFGQDTENTIQSMTVFAASELIKDCEANESGWNALPGSQTLLNQAIAELRPARAAALWAEIQRQQISKGGLLLWGWSDWIDAASKRVRGLTAGKAGPLNNYQVLDAWLAK